MILPTFCKHSCRHCQREPFKLAILHSSDLQQNEEANVAFYLLVIYCTFSSLSLPTFMLSSLHSLLWQKWEGEPIICIHSQLKPNPELGVSSTLGRVAVPLFDWFWDLGQFLSDKKYLFLIQVCNVSNKSFCNFNKPACLSIKNKVVDGEYLMFPDVSQGDILSLLSLGCFSYWCIPLCFKSLKGPHVG